MHYYYTPYIWPLLASTAIAGALAIFTWRRRDVPGARPFFIALLSIVLWALANALEITAIELPVKLFWANVQYLGFVSFPVSWFAIVLQYTGRTRWLRRHLPWLLVIPLLTVILVWSNGLHGLIRRDVHLYDSGALTLIGKTYGPWFWIHTGYSYILLLSGFGLMVRALVIANPIFRGQSLTLLCSFLLPFSGNIIYVLHIGPRFPLDLTPVLFGCACILVAWGLFRFRLLDLVPVARAAVIENMDDGVIVLDVRHRIQDLNPAAQRILRRKAGEVIGLPARQALETLPELAKMCRDTMAQGDLDLGVDEEHRSYEAQVSMLPDLGGRLGGRLIILHDTTERRLAQNQLVQQQRAVAVLEERERLARELHDNVAQVLGFVNLRALATRDLIAGDRLAQADESLKRLATVALQAQSEVREYIRQVTAGVVVERPFLATLKEYLGDFERTHGIPAELIMAGDFPEKALTPEVRLQLLRIVQESLTNVWRHAGADRVRVTLTNQGGTIQVSVEDNGRGFDMDRITASRRSGFGLGIMRERAGEAGGILEIHAVPGQGTQVVVRIPLAGGSEARHEGSAGG